MDPVANPTKNSTRPHLGSDLMPSTGYERLMAIDVRRIKRVKYRGKDLWWIVNVLRYIGFMHDIDQHNRSRVISRPEMDALWVRILMGRYGSSISTNAVDHSERSLLKKKYFAQKKLRSGLSQRWGDRVEAYWAGKHNANPGLDISCPPDHNIDSIHEEVDNSPGAFVFDLPDRSLTR